MSGIFPYMKTINFSHPKLSIRQGEEREERGTANPTAGCGGNPEHSHDGSHAWMCQEVRIFGL